MIETQFGPFEGKIWLNTAGEGPLPRVAADALNEALEWKVKPYLLTMPRFRETPARLKKAVSRLLNVQPSDVILGNSTTYGIHLLANGIPFECGDEILLMKNDFPADILPWLALQGEGVSVKQISSVHPVIQPDELEKHITDKTRLVCLPHVHSFSGHVVDIQRIGQICRERNILFVVNLAQSAGNIPIDLSRLQVDAVTAAGFKWLCGPYGTGFCWMTESLRQSLRYNHAYWVNMMSERDLESTDALHLPEISEASRYDMFGTANFFNYRPLTASIELLCDAGIFYIERHNGELVQYLLENLDNTKYNIISPKGPGKRSSLFVFSHTDRNKNRHLFKTLTANHIYGAFWKGNLRLSPHVFNTQDEMSKVIIVLNEYQG